MGYGVPAAVAASLLYPERTVVNIAGDGDFLMTGQELATAIRIRRAPADQHRRRQRRVRHDPHAPGARVPRSSHRHRHRQSRLRRAGARVRVARESIEKTAEFAPAFERALAVGEPTLLHLRLSPDVSTSRTTLTAIRDSALERRR